MEWFRIMDLWGTYQSLPPPINRLELYAYRGGFAFIRRTAYPLAMRLKHRTRFMVGFRPIVEAVEGDIEPLLPCRQARRIILSSWQG